MASDASKAPQLTQEEKTQLAIKALQEAPSHLNGKQPSSTTWAAGLKPFNPTSILQKYRPKTTPFASLTNKGGVRINLAQQVHEIVGQLMQVCATPHQPKMRFIRDTALIALADKHPLQFMNEGLVRKSKEGRQNKIKKNFGVARILTIEDALRKEEREAKEQQEMDEKERRAILRGLVGFAKMVWKEFHMGKDVFE